MLLCTFTLCGYISVFVFFFFKQKTAYEMRISDWSSDVCSSDLAELGVEIVQGHGIEIAGQHPLATFRLGDVTHFDQVLRHVFDRDGVGGGGLQQAPAADALALAADRKCTRLNSSTHCAARMPSHA